MNPNDFFNEARKEFPKLNIKYKNESFFMKLLGFILFFNKGFMTNFITTIGNTVYFPSKEYVDKNPFSAKIVLLHELVHIYDSNKLTSLLFSFLYLFPISLFPILFTLLTFIFTWKIALLSLLLLAPLPAYFRMVFERRGYTASMYALCNVNAKLKIVINVPVLAKSYVKHFKNGDYYFMWMFKDIDKKLEEYAYNIQLGGKPLLEKELYEKLDRLISHF